MFEQTFVQTQAQTRKPWTVAVSLSLQFLAIGIVLVIPLLHPENLRMPGPPQPRLIRTWITQPPPPAQHAAARTSAVTAPVASRVFVYRPPIAQSTAVQQSIEMPAGDPDLGAWAGPAGVQFGSGLTAAVALPPVAPTRPIVPVSPKPVPIGPLKVSEGVAAAKLIFGPAPTYPHLAVVTHTQGVVRLEAVIATNGNIENLRVVSGPPLLVNAAVEAVRQWRYHPTLLNGVAVEVLTEIDVNFALSR